MSTAYSRRASRIVASPPHSQTWRDCANDPDGALRRAQQELDGARGMLAGASIALIVWLVLAALLWWSLEVLAVTL